MAFDQQKTQSLNGIDWSKKGSFDAPIEDLIAYVNSRDDFFTTSSCSGRINVFIQGDTKKKGCKWLLTSHGTINPTGVIDAICSVDEEVVLKYEAFILHVQCRSLENAKDLLKIALESGYRNSGMVIGKKKKIMLAVRSTHGLEVPLVFNRNVKVTNEYIAELVKLANFKMEDNLTRVAEFTRKVKESFGDDVK